MGASSSIIATANDNQRQPASIAAAVTFVHNFKNNAACRIVNNCTEEEKECEYVCECVPDYATPCQPRE